MKPLRETIAVTGILCAVLAAAPLEAAEWSSPSYGGGGGRPYNLDCGPGAVLAGVTGKAGEWVDSITAVCRRVKADGNLGDTFTRGPTGGSGGRVQSRPCPTGKVVGGIVAWTAGSYVKKISLHCYSWSVSTKRLSGVSYWLSVIEGLGGVGVLGAVLTGGYEHSPADCPADGKPGKALRGRSGGYIDSVRLVCDDWNR